MMHHISNRPLLRSAEEHSLLCSCVRVFRARTPLWRSFTVNERRLANHERGGRGAASFPVRFRLRFGKGRGQCTPPPNLNRGANMCENTRGLE